MHHHAQHRVQTFLDLRLADGVAEGVHGRHEGPGIFDAGDVGAVANDGAGPRRAVQVFDDDGLGGAPFHGQVGGLYKPDIGGEDILATEQRFLYQIGEEGNAGCGQYVGTGRKAAQRLTTTHKNGHFPRLDNQRRA